MSVGDNWDKQAASYEVVAPNLSNFAQDAITLSSNIIQPNSRILEVAAGTGAMTIPLLQNGHRVSATDLSPGMLEQLKNKLKHCNLQCEINVCDGQTLELYEDASFDTVVSQFGIFLFPDRCAGWKSAHRVLKPSGHLLSLSWSKDAETLGFFAAVLESQNPENKETFFANKCFTKQGFKEEVESCGFTNVEIYETRHDFVHLNGKLFLDGVKDNPVLGPIFKKLGQAKVAQIGAEYFKKESEDAFLKEPCFMLGKALICIASKK